MSRVCSVKRSRKKLKKTKGIDKMSSLHDDLLLKILSSLPLEDVLATSVLSKRWRFLWKNITKLNYDECNDRIPLNKYCLLQFVSKFLPFGNATRVLQSFHLKRCPTIDAQLDRYFDLLGHLTVKEVRIESVYGDLKLPSDLYDTQWFLETLILERLSLVDTYHLKKFLYLKTIHLLSVRFSDDESVERLLTSCPVLEHLVVRRTTYVNVEMFNINVPTLKSLSIDYSSNLHQSMSVHHHGFSINAPSLRYLNIKDSFSNFLRFGDMPELVKASVDVVDCHNFVGSFTSVRYFSLCSKTSKILHPTSNFFNLEHVELCTCSPVLWNLLNSMLKDAPRLQVLKLKLKHDHSVRYNSNDPRMDRWKQPSSVPECLESHLGIFEWRHYNGTKQEKKVAKYILANANCLKMATFSTLSTKKKQIFKKLEYVARGSQACKLVFE